MHTLKILTGGLVALALTVTTFAQAPSSKAKTVSTAAAKPAAVTAARGTLTAVDPAANSITLKSGQHEWTFTLASGAAIREGSKSITISDLANHKGHEAKVRYSESGSTKTAQSVTVAPPAKMAKPAAKPA